MSDLKRYQTNHLVLLVGTNPLPNYVAARLLSNVGGHIYLLHTKTTLDIAERLKTSLASCKLDQKIELREIDESNGTEIRRKTRELVLKIESESIGLNYTGGTKGMAVHTYRAIEKEKPAAIFSYLDARSLSMMIEGQGKQTVPIPVADSLTVTLKQLIELHERKVKEPSSEPIFSEVASELARLASSDSDTEWRGWLEWVNSSVRKPGNTSKSLSQGQMKKVSVPSDKEMVATVLSALGATSTLGEIQLPEKWKGDYTNLSDWMHGNWLEHYVLYCVRDLAQECNIHDCGVGLKPARDGQNFEFDVAAMRGYQLFGISCTTSSSKSLCKSKLFEAYSRVRQMGGDEALTALVCFCNEPDTKALKREIHEGWFTENRVQVFGRHHIANLKDHLRAWFDSTKA